MMHGRDHLGHRAPTRAGASEKPAQRDMRKRPPKTAEPKPLWTCPRCRRQFAHRNQAHSCGDFSVEQLLVDKPSDIVELYDRLADVIQSCGEVLVAPTKTRVLFKARTVFATTAICKNWLDLLFVLGRR